MAPSTQIILSGMLTFGVPLALAVRDLMTLRPGRSGPGWNPEPPEPVRPPPDGDGGSELPALPACLILAGIGVGPHEPSRRLRELV